MKVAIHNGDLPKPIAILESIFEQSGLTLIQAAFTAGWNLCYMPFWIGMLTEDQHPHELLLKTIQQASYDLFFRNPPVCTQPDFVHDHGVDLATLLGDQPLQILRPNHT